MPSVDLSDNVFMKTGVYIGRGCVSRVGRQILEKGPVCCVSVGAELRLVGVRHIWKAGKTSILTLLIRFIDFFLEI